MGDAEPAQEATSGEPQQSEGERPPEPTPPPPHSRLEPPDTASDTPRPELYGDRGAFSDGYGRSATYPPPVSHGTAGYGGGGGALPPVGAAPAQQKLAAQHEDPYSFSDDVSEPTPPVVSVEKVEAAAPPLLPFQFPKKRGRKPKKLLEAMAAAGMEVPKYKTPVRSGDPSRPRKKHDRFNGLTPEQLSRLTLPDYLASGLDIVFIGINPGMTAAYKGHHYAGPGNHFWKCLYMAGLIPEPLQAEDDFKLMELKIGFTNIVSRTTKGSQELTRREIKEGGKVLLQKLKLFQPKVAVFNGKGIYEIFSGKKEFMFGKQPEKIEGTQTNIWVMPSSSARCAQLPRALDKVPFYSALKKFRDHLNGEIAELDDSEVMFEPPKPARRLAAEAAAEEAVAAVLSGTGTGTGAGTGPGIGAGTGTDDTVASTPSEPGPGAGLQEPTVPVKKKRGRPRKVHLDENGVPLPARPRKPAARRAAAQNGDLAADGSRRGRRKKPKLEEAPPGAAGPPAGGALSSMYEMSEQLAAGMNGAALTSPGYPAFSRHGGFSPSYLQQQQQQQDGQPTQQMKMQQLAAQLPTPQQSQQPHMQQQGHNFSQQQAMSQDQQLLQQQAHLSQQQQQSQQHLHQHPHPNHQHPHQLQRQHAVPPPQQSPQHPHPHPQQQLSHQQFPRGPQPHPGLRDDPTPRAPFSGGGGGMFPPYGRQQGLPSPPVGYQQSPGGGHYGPVPSSAAGQFCRSPAPGQFGQSPAQTAQYGQQSPAAGGSQYGQQSPAHSAPYGQQSPAQTAPYGQQSPANSGQFGQQSPVTGNPPQFGQSPASAQYGQSPANASQFSQSPSAAAAPFGQSPAAGQFSSSPVPQFGQSPSGGALYRQSPGMHTSGVVPGSPAAFNKCSSLQAEPPPDDPAGLCLTPPPTSPSLGQPDFEAPASMLASDGADGSVTSLLPKDEPTEPSSASVASSQPSFSNPTTPADGGGQFAAAGGAQQSPAHYPYTPNSQPAEFPPQQQAAGFATAAQHPAKSDMATKSLSDLESLVDQIPSLSGQEAMLSGPAHPAPQRPTPEHAAFSPGPRPGPAYSASPGAGAQFGGGGYSGWGGAAAGYGTQQAAAASYGSTNFSVMSLASSSVPAQPEPQTATAGAQNNPFSIPNLAAPAQYNALAGNSGVGMGGVGAMGGMSVPGGSMAGFSAMGNMSAATAGVYPYGAYGASAGYGSHPGAFPYSAAAAAGFHVPPSRFGYPSPYGAPAAYHQQAYTQQAVYERLKQEQMEMRFGGF